MGLRVLRTFSAIAVAGVWSGCLVSAATREVPPPNRETPDVVDAPSADEAARSDVEARGLRCDPYCSAIMAQCTGVNAQYESLDQCLSTCASFPSGVYGEVDDTLGCRLFQVNQPPPENHCTRAGALGGEYCGSPCATFCSLAVALCRK